MDTLGLGVTLSMEDKFSGPLGSLSSKFARFREEFEKQADAVENAQKMMTTGLATMAAGASGLAAAGLAVTQFAKNQFALAEVSTLVDTTAVNMEELKQVNEALAMSFGIGELDQVAGMYQAISAGVNPATESMNAFLTVANKMAIGGKTDMKTAVDGLTTVMNAFRSEGLSTEQISDQMFATMKGGKTTIQELSSFMFQAAPIASAMGVKFAEVNAAVVALSKSGTPTSVAMTQIRAALVGLTRPSDDLNEIFGKTKERTAENFVKVHGLKEALVVLNKAVKGSASGLNQLLGGSEAAGAAISILKDNAKDFDEALASIQNSTGASDEAFQKMKNTLTNLYNVVKQKVLVSLSRFGETLAPLVSTLLDKISDLTDSVANMNPEWKEALMNTLLFGSAAAVLVGGVMVLGGALAYAQIAAAALGISLGWLFVIPALIAGAAILIFKFRNEIMEFIDRFGVILGPIGMVIQFRREIAAMAHGFWNGFVQVMRPAIERFIEATAPLRAVLQQVWGAIKQTFNWVVEKMGIETTTGSLEAFGVTVGRAAAWIANFTVTPLIVGFQLVSSAIQTVETGIDFASIKIAKFIAHLGLAAEKVKAFFNGKSVDSEIEKHYEDQLKALESIKIKTLSEIRNPFDVYTPSKEQDAINQKLMEESEARAREAMERIMSPAKFQTDFLQNRKVPVSLNTEPMGFVPNPNLDPQKFDQQVFSGIPKEESDERFHQLARNFSLLSPQKPESNRPLTVNNKIEASFEAKINEEVLFKIIDKREISKLVRQEQ